MSINGDCPCLDDARELLHAGGHHPVLLYIRAQEKGPYWKGWPKVTYAETQTEDYQFNLRTHTNVGVLLGAPSEDLCAFDFDTDAALEGFLALNPAMQDTLRSKGAHGAQLWAYIPGERPRQVQRLMVAKNSPLTAGMELQCNEKTGEILEQQTIGEFRAEGGQSIIAGIHPQKDSYRWLVSNPPISIRFGDIVWPPDIAIPWEQKRHSATGANDSAVLQRAIAALSIDFLWNHFGYPERRKNPVHSPFHPQDKETSFSVYDQGRHFKDFDPAYESHRGDSYDFYQLATGQDGKQAFKEFVILAGLGDELQPQPKAHTKNRSTADLRPVIMHPNDDSYITEFAAELGRILKTQGFYQYKGRAVQIRDVTVKGRNGKEHQVKKLVELTVPVFSTIIENYCRPMRRKRKKLVHESISLEVAARTLVCLDFVCALPEIKLWSDVRLPIRAGETIVLTQPGYDPLSGVYTSPDAPPINENLALEQADEQWRALMAEFCFPKSGKTEKEEPD